MLKINAEVFYRAVVAQNTFQQMVSGFQDKTGTPPPATRDILIGHTEKLEVELRLLGAKVASIANRRLLQLLKSKEPSFKRISEEVWEVNSRLRDELSGISLFCLPESEARFYSPEDPLFGSEVAEKFPSSNYDIEEAGKCLALRRATACVAHLMRALEPALRCLAGELGVTFGHQNWHNILDQIEKEIRNKGAGPHPPGWKNDEQFFSESAAHFRLLKDAWRNHTMHLRDRYDEERAEVVFMHVRLFMRHLSARLSESPE
jgi:hypothetical protein